MKNMLIGKTLFSKNFTETCKQYKKLKLNY